MNKQEQARKDALITISIIMRKTIMTYLITGINVMV